MARSKPTRSLTLTYAAYSATNDAGTLFPCLIGPRYILHKLENANTLVGKFVSGKGIYQDKDTYITELAYPNKNIGQVIIDPADVEIKLQNTLLEVASDLKATGIKTGTTNCILFTEAVAGSNSFKELNGYDLRIGDILTVGATDVVVTDVRAVDKAAEVTIKDIAGSIPAGVEVSQNFTGSDESIYLIIVKNKTEEYVEAEVSVAKGDLNVSTLSNVRFTLGNATAIGSMGITVTFSDAYEYDATNNALIVNAMPTSSGDFKEVYINDSSLSVNENTVIKAYTKNIVSDAVSVAPNMFSAKQGAVNIDKELKIYIGNKSYAVKEADLHIIYRELLTEDANQLITGNSESLAQFIGEVDPRNPLAFMAYCAQLAGTNSFYLVSTEGTDDASYIKAANVAFKYEDVFTPITFSQSKAVNVHLQSKMAEYNDPKIAQFKKLWIIDKTEKLSTVYDKTSDGVSLLVKIAADGTVTFVNGDIVAAGVSVGDTLVIPRHYDANSQSYIKKEFKITTIKDADELTVASVDETISTPEVAYIVRGLSNYDYALTVASKAAAFNSPYINYVWADGAECIGYGEVDPVFLLATLAGMRAAHAPHAPLSEVVVPGWTTADRMGLTEADLDIMNNKGVWIVYKDRYGEVVNRHQLTTVQDGTVAEEDSAVSNACNIIRSIRAMLASYRGDANVTDELVDALHADLAQALDRIMARSYSVKVGRQLLDYSINDLKIDEDNRARIILDADLDVPEPLLDGHYKFNII